MTDPLGEKKNMGEIHRWVLRTWHFPASKNWPWRPWFHGWCHAWRIMQLDATAMPRDHSIPISGLPWKTVVPIHWGPKNGEIRGTVPVWIPFYNDPKNETNKPNTEMLSKYLGIFWLEAGWTWALRQCFNGDSKGSFFHLSDGTHGIVTTWLGPGPMKSNWLILHQLHLYHTPESILLLVTNKSPLSLKHN